MIAWFSLGADLCPLEAIPLDTHVPQVAGLVRELHEFGLFTDMRGVLDLRSLLQVRSNYSLDTNI